jgi:tyrosine-specific transport protein
MFKLNQTIAGIATLAGTIIGVGLFALPYIAMHVGLWTMLGYFLVLSAVTILINLMYGEVALRTKKLSRLPGYAEKYLGGWGKKTALLCSVLGISGALLAYLIVGGGFLFSLFEPILGGNVFCYVIIFFAAGSFLVFTGIRDISKTEFLLLISFFVVLVFIFYKGFSLINPGYLFNFDAKHLFLPYGAILFSLSGMSLIPEIKEMMTGSPASLKKIIIISIILAAITYLFFIIVILGLTGPQTSKEAISGLKNVFGNGLVTLAFILGVLTTFTSFITLGLTLKKIFWYDLRIKRNTSWALACFTPLVFYLLGFKNFLAVISLTGAITVGIAALLVILMFFKAKKKGDKMPAYQLNVPAVFVWLIGLMFFLGIVYQVWYFV